jgi:chemotaxis response regulator CheB
MKTPNHNKKVLRELIKDKLPKSKSRRRSGSRAGTPSRKHLRKASSSPAGAGFPIVGVGASVGGLEAFTHLLENLPTNTGMGFVLVQHLDPDHNSALTQLLSRATSLPVREVTNNLRVQPDHVYIIPPNTCMSISRGVLKLRARQEQARTAHHSIDFFLESLAQDQHERAIGIILSGTASDGTLGLEAIKAEDGITFAQDESAKYDSMPRSAVAADVWISFSRRKTSLGSWRGLPSAGRNPNPTCGRSSGRARVEPGRRLPRTSVQ